MSYKVQCNNHKAIKFTIPNNLTEAIDLNAFPDMREMAHHLRNNPKCKMLRVEDYD